jgi:hypothetical protein
MELSGQVGMKVADQLGLVGGKASHVCGNFVDLAPMFKKLVFFVADALEES